MKQRYYFLYSPTVKAFLFIIPLFCFANVCFAQVDSIAIKTKKDTVIFNPKEEISYDGKRYRVYNNWLSVGAGVGYNSHWSKDEKDEKNIAADFSFHIKQYYFRLGGFLSGRDFNLTNNYSFHGCIGLRKETPKYNLSGFIGPSSSYFRRPLSDSTEYGLQTVLSSVYNRVGGYACLEAVYKIKYDVGVGGQIFCDYNEVQTVYGVRLIVYFSGAYRGIKYGRGTPKKK